MQLLVAPVNWTKTMSIKRRFEDAEVPVRVLGASGLDAAISQLEKSNRYQAVLIDWDEAPGDAIALSCAIKERGQPIVVAYQRHWTRDDIRRALQLGVDSLMLDSFTSVDVMRDIRAIQDNGVSVTRAQIIEQGGPELMEADPSLWADQADGWRDRMISVADHLSRPWSEDMSDHANHMEVSVRRSAQIDQLSPNMARAVLEVLSQGRDRIPEVTARYRIDAEELLHVLAAVESFAAKHGGATRIPLLMDAVLNRDQDRDEDNRSPRLMVLKRVARVVIKANGLPARRKDPLNETIKKFLGVSERLSATLNPQQRYNLAVRLIMLQDEQDALDYVGFALVGQLLRRSKDSEIGETHIEALNALLGFDGRYVGIDPKKLIRELAVLNPIPSLAEIDLLDLNAFKEAIDSSAFSDYSPLINAIDQLLDVGRVLGPIDQKRLKDLSHAIRHELPVLVGRPAWISLRRGFTQSAEPPTDQIVQRLTFLMGARADGAVNRLSSALGDLIEVGRNAMDAARFSEFCRQACAEVLSKDVISEFAGETHNEFTPDRVDRQGAAEKRALLEGALTSFVDMNIDLDEIRHYLPPVPPGYTTLTDQEMTRMQVLAAVLEGRPMREQAHVMSHFLGQHKLHQAELDALRAMLGNGPLIDLAETEYLDPLGAYRDGFDYELEDEYGDEFEGDEFDFADDDDDENWDVAAADEELISIADTPAEKLFDVGAAPPPQPSRPPHQVDSFDLGLEELELELDLAGGVFELDASVTGSLDVSGDGGGYGSRAGISVRGDDVRGGLGSVRMDDDLRETYGTVEQEGDGATTESIFGGMNEPMDRGLISQPLDAADQFGNGTDDQFDDSAFAQPASVPSFDASLSGGFDLGPAKDIKATRKRERASSDIDKNIPMTRKGRLDLEAIKDMIDKKQLKDAARLLHGAPDDIPDLAEGLHLAALHAFCEERHHAAQMLWTRAHTLEPDRPNILFSLARVRIELGKYAEARPLLDTLAVLMPHFSLANDLMDIVRHRAGADS